MPFADEDRRSVPHGEGREMKRSVWTAGIGRVKILHRVRMFAFPTGGVDKHAETRLRRALSGGWQKQHTTPSIGSSPKIIYTTEV